MTTSGGTVDLLYDYLEEVGGVATPDFTDATKAKLRSLLVQQELEMKNPLDAGNPIDDAADAALCRAVVADPNIDILAWGGSPPSGKRVRDPAVTKSIADATDKPVFGFIRMASVIDKATVKFQDEVGFPFLQGLHVVASARSARSPSTLRARDAASPALPPPHGQGGDIAGSGVRSGARPSRT